MVKLQMDSQISVKIIGLGNYLPPIIKKIILFNKAMRE